MMKTIIKLTLSLCFLSFGWNVSAQSETGTTKLPTSVKKDTVLTVNGICSMCQRTIEKAALTDGVFLAQWDVETKALQLSYDPAIITLATINKRINKVGYDTEISAATDEEYNTVHGCCRYRDPEVVNQHKD